MQQFAIFKSSNSGQPYALAGGLSQRAKQRAHITLLTGRMSKLGHVREQTHTYVYMCATTNPRLVSKVWRAWLCPCNVGDHAGRGAALGSRAPAYLRRRFLAPGTTRALLVNRSSRES